MKMATSEAGKAAFELGMEIVGPLAPVTDPTFADANRFVARVLHVVREHDRGRQLRDPAQHHRPARARACREPEHAVDFSLTDDQELLRDTARKLLERECPPVARPRAHRRPSVYEPLWRHLREYTALGAGPAADLCLFLEQTGYVAAPGPFLATVAVRRRSPATTSTPGTVALVDDPTNPFVLEADRVDRDRDRRARTAARGRRRRRRRDRLRFVADRRLLPPAVRARRHRSSTSTAKPLDADALRGVARPRARRARGRDGRHRPPHLRHGARVREGAQAVRRADRLVPGDPAQARRHVARARAGDRRGALRGDDGRRRRPPTARRACHVAKAAAGEAARRILKDGIQIHGGIGYTWEHDLHLYLRRATADEYPLGTTGWHLDRLADLLFATAERRCVHPPRRPAGRGQRPGAALHFLTQTSGFSTDRPRGKHDKPGADRRLGSVLRHLTVMQSRRS